MHQSERHRHDQLVTQHVIENELDGDPLHNWSDLFYRSPVGVAAMTGSDAADQQWLNAIFDNAKQAHVNYYSDSVTLGSLLVMSGNFIDPASITAVPEPGSGALFTTCAVACLWQRRRMRKSLDSC